MGSASIPTDGMLPADYFGIVLFLASCRQIPVSLVDQSGENLDPFRVWDVLMTNEKPGGHGERSVAVGVVDMAVWDTVAKIAGVPLYQLLADRYGDGQAEQKVFVYAAGGYYYPGKDLRGAAN